MNKNYEVYYFSPDNPLHLEQWLEGILQTTGLRLLAVSGDYWIFEQTLLLDETAKTGGFASDALESYGGFYDKAVMALGFSSASLPSPEMDVQMLQKISNLFLLVKDLTDALTATYNKLPAHWRDDLGFSYFGLMNRAKKLGLITKQRKML
jgi:hypothetical protein